MSCGSSSPTPTPTPTPNPPWTVGVCYLAEGTQRAAYRVAVHPVTLEAPLPPELTDGATAATLFTTVTIAAVAAVAAVAVAVLGGPFGRGEQRRQPKRHGAQPCALLARRRA